MCDVLVAENPSGKKIKYYDDKHIYIDENSNKYKSVTTIIHSLFPEFEQAKMAFFTARKRVMMRDGYGDKDDVPMPKIMEERDIVLNEWEEGRLSAGILGNEVHRYAECKLKGIPFDGHFSGERQIKMSKVVDAFIPELFKSYDYIDSEKIIFTPHALVAGTVDLIMRNKKTNRLCVFDWKTNKTINQTDSYGQKGKLFLNHVEHCNYFHYALQLNVYQYILKSESYGDYDKVELGLFHVNTQSVKPYSLPSMQLEAESIINYCKNLR